jgi:hypothetical protein
MSLISMKHSIQCGITVKILETFFRSEQLIVGPSLFESSCLQPFESCFYLTKMSLLRSAAHKEPPEGYISA